MTLCPGSLVGWGGRTALTFLRVRSFWATCAAGLRTRGSRAVLGLGQYEERAVKAGTERVADRVVGLALGGGVRSRAVVGQSQAHFRGGQGEGQQSARRGEHRQKRLGDDPLGPASAHRGAAGGALGVGGPPGGAAAGLGGEPG